MYDLSLPEGRAMAIEVLGIDGYDKAMEEHARRTTILFAGGHRVRVLDGTRWGRLFQVGTTGLAFVTVDAAIKYAEAHPTLDHQAVVDQAETLRKDGKAAMAERLEDRAKRFVYEAGDLELVEKGRG